tara:strand:+ start:495 stop:1334 length:840 start_codon:yes stop_codon:yes gene_type:complete
MKTLILGSSGKIGKFFIKKNKNLVFTYNKNKILGGIKFNLNKDNISHIINKFNIRKVIILSAYSEPDFCFKYKKKSHRLNVQSTQNIIKTLIKKNIYFIYFSTEFVYDGKNKNYKEISKTKPNTTYGNQKLIVEKFIKKNTDNYAIFRISKTYSKKKNEKDFVSEFYNNIKKNITNFKAATDQIFNPIYVKDIVKISNFFLKKEIRGTFNIAGPQPLSRYECLQILRSKLSKKMQKKITIQKIKLLNIKFIEKRPLNLSLNIQKLQNIYPYELKYFNEL